MQTPGTSKVTKTRSGGRQDSQSNKKVYSSVLALDSSSSVTHEMDSHIKRVLNPGRSDQNDTDEGGYSAGEMDGNVQTRILAELKKMKARLDVVDHQVAGASGTSKHGNQDSKLSKSVNGKTYHKSRTVSSESSE